MRFLSFDKSICNKQNEYGGRIAWLNASRALRDISQNMVKEKTATRKTGPLDECVSKDSTEKTKSSKVFFNLVKTHVFKSPQSGKPTG